MRSRIVEQPRLDLRVQRTMVRTLPPDDERRSVDAQSLYGTDHIQRRRKHQRSGNDLSGSRRSAERIRQNRGGTGVSAVGKYADTPLRTG